MSDCSMCCMWCSGINWLWYAVSVIVVFGVGAIWYSMLFVKQWIRVYKIEMPAEGEKVNPLPSMLMQLIATALLGLAFFVLTPISVWLSVLVLIGFAAWQKAGLKFHFRGWRDFIIAASIDVGYLCVAAIIFILFALL